MMNDVIQVDANSNDKTILSSLTDDSFIEYHSNFFSTNTSFKIKDSWWNINSKDIFSKSNDIATSIIIDLKKMQLEINIPINPNL